MEKHKFSKAWLTEREFFDNQSRSNLLIKEIKKDSRSINKIIDLGCGTGSFLRWCIAQKLSFSEAMLIDFDRRLINSIGMLFRRFLKNKNYTIKKVNTREYLVTNLSSLEKSKILFLKKNIINSLDKIDRYDLVSLSALSDLLSKNIIRRLLSKTNRNKYIYFSLCFNGKIRWSPVNEFDNYVINKFNKHQIQDKGFGIALGENSIRYIESIANKNSYVYTKKDSSWKINSFNIQGKSFQEKYLKIILTALKNDDITDKDILKLWFSKRMQSIKHIKSKLIVGHNDILIKT